MTNPVMNVENVFTVATEVSGKYAPVKIYKTEPKSGEQIESSLDLDPLFGKRWLRIKFTYYGTWEATAWEKGETTGGDVEIDTWTLANLDDVEDFVIAILSGEDLGVNA